MVKFVARRVIASVVVLVLASMLVFVIVREFGAGEVVPPDDPAALAAACSRLLEPDALAAAAHGADTAARALTWEAAAAQHEEHTPA